MLNVFGVLGKSLIHWSWSGLNELIQELPSMIRFHLANRQEMECLWGEINQHVQRTWSLKLRGNYNHNQKYHREERLLADIRQLLNPYLN